MFIYNIGDVISLVIIVFFVLALLIVSIRTHLEQSKCKHEKYFETSSCNAICIKCGKNLGFIGNLRDKHEL
jgi:hypothetical protein